MAAYYELTPLGRSLGKAVAPLGAWVQCHIEHIARVQAEFDKKIDT
jgi:DNA-binding HxlR family transcriptional regulator